MRFLFFSVVFAAELWAQPNVVFINDTLNYFGDDGFTLDQLNHFTSIAGYQVDGNRAACIGYPNFNPPHPAAQVLDSTIAIDGTNPNGSYVMIPIQPSVQEWLAGNQNFAWFDAWSDQLLNAATFLDLISELVLDFNNGTFLTWDGFRYRGNVTRVGLLIVPLDPLVPNIFTNPILTVRWYRTGDVTGNYSVDEFDVDVVQAMIGLTGQAAAPFDWDRDGDVDHDDVLDWVASYGSLPGDANGDGEVNNIDFNTWALNMFQTGTSWSRADFNSDGVTDVSDFNIWNDNRTDI